MKTSRTKLDVLKSERRLLITVVAGFCLALGAAALVANEYLELHKQWYELAGKEKLLTQERDMWHSKTVRFDEEMQHVDREMDRYDGLISELKAMTAEVKEADGCRKKLRAARKELKTIKK